jgi:hypothetical protein
MAVAEDLPAVRGAFGGAMTTVYLQHSVTSIGIGKTGHVHNRVATAPGDESPTAIDCAECEKWLVKEGAVYSPEQVPLTDRQIAAREKVEREGGVAVKAAAEALAATAASVLAGNASPDRRPRRKTSASGT